MDDKNIPDNKEKSTTKKPNTNSTSKTNKTSTNAKKPTDTKKNSTANTRKPTSNAKGTTRTVKKTSPDTQKKTANSVKRTPEGAKKKNSTAKKPTNTVRKTSSSVKKKSSNSTFKNFTNVLLSNKRSKPKKKKRSMKKMFSSRKIKGVIIFLGFILLIAIIFGVFILYTMATDYKPVEQTTLIVDNNKADYALFDDQFSITTYNIGYGGLDKAQDFFMDGGKKSRSSSKEKTRANIESVVFNLDKIDSDFLFIQEIDVNSTRSFNLNEYETLQENLTVYGSTFGKNYDVAYVPVPVYKPMGSVESGIGTFSKYNIKSSTRYSLPVDQTWPNSLFLLDRCMTQNVIELDNGKQLVLVNLHLSAYDDGTVRTEQINMLKNYMESIYNEDTYVILGGDWNHYLVDNPDNVDNWVAELPSNFLPQGWQFAVDKDVPTVRDLDAKYSPETTFTAIIDGFVVSPNIDIINVTGNDLYFENSDHNPVTLEFKLK